MLQQPADVTTGGIFCLVGRYIHFPYSTVVWNKIPCFLMIVSQDKVGSLSPEPVWFLACPLLLCAVMLLNVHSGSGFVILVLGLKSIEIHKK